MLREQTDTDQPEQPQIQHIRPTKRKYNSRRTNLDKKFKCHIDNCPRKYSSRIALNSHLRKKHHIFNYWNDNKLFFNLSILEKSNVPHLRLKSININNLIESSSRLAPIINLPKTRHGYLHNEIIEFVFYGQKWAQIEIFMYKEGWRGGQRWREGKGGEIWDAWWGKE